MKTYLLAFSLLFALALRAQEKTFVREYTYNAGELDSKSSSRTIALNQLRTTLLNEIGVYVESEHVLKSKDIAGKFSQDFVENISTLSGGVTKLEVLDEKWNGETFWMKASITIDEKSLAESLKQLSQDRQKAKELETAKTELKKATEELSELKGNANKEQYAVQAKRVEAAGLLFNGYEKFSRGDYKAALADFDKAVKLDSGNVRAYIGRGFCRSKLGDTDGEIDDYTYAIAIDPNDASIYYNRGVARNRIDDREGEMEDFDMAIRLDPKYSVAYYNRGIAKSRRQDDASAIADYSKAIEADPNQVDSYINRASAKARVGDKNGALKDFDIAIKMRPRHAPAYVGRGDFKLGSKDYRDALKDYDKAIKLNQKDAHAYYNRAVSEYYLGKKKKACRDFSKAGELGESGAYVMMKNYCN